MVHTIWRGASVVANLHLTGTVTEAIIDISIVQAEVITRQPLELQVGDRLRLYNKDYYLNGAPELRKASDYQYEYSMVFESKVYDLAKAVFAFLSDDNTLKEPEFDLVADAYTVLDLLVRNANRQSPGWEIGQVDGTVGKQFAFNRENCLNVLSRLAQEFDNEYWVDGQTIHFTRRGKIIPDLVFEYGKAKGLKEMTRKKRDDSNVVTRLFVYGSTRNLRGDYRNHSKRLRMPAAIGDKLEQNIQQYGQVIEHWYINDEIYPHRIGYITEAFDDDPLAFVDSGMPADFDINDHTIPGLVPTVIFLAGDLSGYELQLNRYNHATRTFAMNKHPEPTIDVPSRLFRPRVGEPYVIVNIWMPKSYEDAAEFELRDEAQKYLEKNSVPRVTYEVKCDPLHFKREGIQVPLGDYIRVVDSELGIDVNLRVAKTVRDINNPFDYTLDLSEHIAPSAVARIYAEQAKVNRLLQVVERGGRAGSSGSVEPVVFQRVSYLPDFNVPPAGYFPLSFGKDAQGFVHLQGAFNYTGEGGMFNVCVLPENFRPDRTTVFYMGSIQLMILKSGVVSVSYARNGQTFHVNGFYFRSSSGVNPFRLSTLIGPFGG